MNSPAVLRPGALPGACTFEEWTSAARPTPATTGIDVSFGLPAGLLPAAVDTWRTSVQWFAEGEPEA
jgi:hypothetical protein